MMKTIQQLPTEKQLKRMLRREQREIFWENLKKSPAMTPVKLCVFCGAVLAGTGMYLKKYWPERAECEHDIEQEIVAPVAETTTQTATNVPTANAQADTVPTTQATILANDQPAIMVGADGTQITVYKHTAAPATIQRSY